MEARAYAATRDSARCAHLLVEAERALDQGRGEVSEWVNGFDEGSLASEVTRCMFQLGQYEQARQTAQRIVDLRRGRVRSHALGQLALAQVLAAQQEPDEACAVTEAALDETRALSSYPVLQEFRYLQRQLRYHRRSRPVGDFLPRLELALGDRLRTFQWLATHDQPLAVTETE
ncbi:hypothetical protein [Actinomadura sp. 6N118]|uniref:hypothetical protein n=1 Tax=Actinomadura sp. 6N118 TaxID=3375151 RepID=UPI003790959C